MMKKAAATFSAITILLWVMPLGAFIKTSQEKTACGGSRAMHMCMMGMKAAPPEHGDSKISFSNPSAVEKTQKPASTETGGVLLNAARPFQVELSDGMIRFSELSFTSIILPPLDQVPKF